MDLMSIDVTDVNTCRVGDRATLWGESLSVKTIADCTNTISYQLLTAIGNRVCRHY